VEVLLDSTLVAFDDRIADVFDTGLDPFREAAAAARLAVFGLSRTDLTAADARRTGFFIDFDFAFAFIAIGAATYKGYGSQSQDGLWKAICSIVGCLLPLRESNCCGQPFERRASRLHFNNLSTLFRDGRCLKASMNRNVLWRFNSKSDSISTNFQNGDFDVVGQDNLLVFLTANDQHSNLPLTLGVLNSKEKYRVQKNTNSFEFVLQI
jgi:hypothetical protein